MNINGSSGFLVLKGPCSYLQWEPLLSDCIGILPTLFFQLPDRRHPSTRIKEPLLLPEILQF